MNDRKTTPTSTIEGGIDAIVVGANVEGFVAAGMLARRGYTTILVENNFEPIPNEPVEIAPGFFCTPGDKVLSHFDPEAITMLDLYQHGLNYVQRRLKSTYHFDDATPLENLELLTTSMDGSEALYADDVSELTELLADLHAAAKIFKNFSVNGELSKKNQHVMNWAAVQSIDGILRNRFTDERLARSLIAEAQLYAESRPNDPQTALSLVHKISGEVSGLNGANGYIEGGWQGLVSALRRSCQALGVQFRRGERVKNVIVEGDRVSGIEVMDGGQIRGPIVINTLPANQAFMDHIGQQNLGIDFAGWMSWPRPKIGAVEVAFALKDIDRHTNTDFFKVRHLLTLGEEDLVKAMRKAGDQDIGDRLFLELIFPSGLADVTSPSNGRIAQGYLYPVPNSKKTLEKKIDALTDAAARALECVLPSAKIKAVDFLGFENLKAGCEPVIRQWARSNALTGASALEGYFFAGDEARLGTHFDGYLGRRAALNAISFLENVSY